jgi:hypothetical protein
MKKYVRRTGDEVRLSSVLVVASLCAAVVRAAPPVVENVWFSQRTNSDGTITLAELGFYVRDRVPPLARALYNREQTPEVRGNANADLLKLK